MSLRSEMKAANAKRRKWQTETLSDGFTVALRSLGGGEYLRMLRMATPEGRSEPNNDVAQLICIAMAAHETVNGPRIWNPDLVEDHAEIGEFPLEDLAKMSTAVLGMSGIVDAEGKEVGQAVSAALPEAILSLPVSLLSDSAAA